MAVERTLEEQAEIDILSQDDTCEITLRDLTLVGRPAVWIAFESKKLDKRVTTVNEYYELTEVDGATVIGYQRWGGTKHITKAGENIIVDKAIVIGRRKRGE